MAPSCRRPGIEQSCRSGQPTYCLCRCQPSDVITRGSRPHRQAADQLLERGETVGSAQAGADGGEREQLASVGASGADRTGAGGASADRTGLRQGPRSNKDVTAQLEVTQTTVARWRAVRRARRLDGLFDKPRPGRPPSILPEEVEEAITATREEIPARCHALVDAPVLDGRRSRRPLSYRSRPGTSVVSR
jgi:hypothetical protein